MDEYEKFDGLGLAELVRRKQTTPEALLETAISRTEKRNPELNAVVIPMFDEARAAVQEGLPQGPFHGVPFLLKDLHLFVPGVRTTQGSALYADYVPDRESELVARYRRAGLIHFGKSASPELGLTTTTESALFGATRNPWNLDHTSGGSSGGASAAVAGGLVPLANASDGGGSIRIPASCCGLFGLKPSRGRTPMGPHSGEGWGGMSAVHAVTRSVRDSAALLDATAGPDLGAPYAAQPPERPFLDEVGRPPGTLRIALQTQPWNGAATHPDCEAAARDAAKLCEELGHVVEETDFPVDPDRLRQATMGIISTNVRATLEDRARELGREFREDDVEPATWLVASLSQNANAADYVRATRTIHAIGRELAGFLTEFDVLLTPTMATPPPRIGVLSASNPDRGEQTRTLFETVGFTQLLNATGSPAMSVPLSWNDAGLPIGVQFVGRHGDEAGLFRLAGQLEAARPWFERVPDRK